jgi:hypothetical protein
MVLNFCVAYIEYAAKVRVLRLNTFDVHQKLHFARSDPAERFLCNI